MFRALAVLCMDVGMKVCSCRAREPGELALAVLVVSHFVCQYRGGGGFNDAFGLKGSIGCICF